MVSKGRHIVPASDEDRAKLRAFKPGDALLVKMGKPRNADHHRKFMALVAFVAEHHPTFRRYRTSKPLLHFLKMETGHYDEYVREDGEIIRIPKSIAFDEMDEADFIVWSEQARRILLDDLLPGFTQRDKQRLEREIEGWHVWT